MSLVERLEKLEIQYTDEKNEKNLVKWEVGRSGKPQRPSDSRHESSS